MKQSNNSLWKLFLIILTLFPVLAFGQAGTISGNVSDALTGDPLPGVTIIVKGTTTGTVTMYDGNYSINAAAGQTLVFSFIGYAPVEILVDNQTEINAQLSESFTELDELIVIGYGVQKKEDKTGAVAQIKAEELIGGALTDPMQAIQGKSAGVMITKKGGDPNSGFVVKIRGAAGYDSNTSPLYVVDGIPGVDPTTVAPEDIATIDILKDAASTAIYGSQGSNGVIIINTKRGTEKGQLQFNVRVTADQASSRLNLLSADELRTFSSDNGLTLVDGGANTDWQDEIFQNGLSTNYNLSYAGGNEKTSFYVSGTQAEWEGVIKGTSKARTIGKINIQHKALNDKLTLSSSISGAFEQNDYEDYGGYGLKDILYQAYSRNPTDPVYNADKSFYQIERAFNYVNPLATINEIENVRDAQRFYGNFKADFEIIEGLHATVNTGYIKDDHENTVFEPRDSWASTTAGKGRRAYSNTTKKLIESYVTYDKTIAGSHNLNLVAGHSWQEENNDGFALEGIDAQSDALGADNIGSFVTFLQGSQSSNKDMSRLIGFFGRAQYNYESRYYASTSLRRDGSTKFGDNNKWGWFPTAAIGWNIHREAFLEDVDVISNLKLRLSYGVSGNESLGPNLSRTTFIPAGTATNPDDGATVISIGAENNYNNDLKWEETSEVNIGLDFGFFRNRVSGSIEVYQKATTDLLGRFPVPVPPNVAQFTWGNAGDIQNKGVELNLQVFAIDNANFSWKTNFNAAHNKQTNTDLGGRASVTDGYKYRPEGFIDGRGLTGAWVTGLIEGESLGTFFLPHFVRLIDGNMIYASKDGGYTDNVADAKRVIAGSALPDVELGWSNSMTFFKKVNLDFTLRSMLGNKMFNATAMMFDYPGEFPTLNRLPEAIDWYDQGRISPPAVSDYYIEDASFLRLDYVGLSYDFDTNRLDWLADLKFVLSGNNLFVLTKYSGLDPETSVDGVSFGVDQYNVYPKTRSISIGINATF